jgi:hypothetical protein
MAFLMGTLVKSDITSRLTVMFWGPAQTDPKVPTKPLEVFT